LLVVGGGPAGLATALHAARVPGARLVGCGPYRFLRHPNYVAVVVEGVALPLVHSAWLTATVFTLANAVLLTVRVRCENAALTRAVPA
ncbi:isoprenylcysteine carboxylmethyltransferase family protein, partial [Streptomyces pseudogriseolus]|uniref:isoprenylcysteine carboxylmethyltransferase family protein n=1 Tax=Streptomyces pseudogriseolus TaxID=36817 RepID=UPI003FA1C74B